METKHDLYLGDCEEALQKIPDKSVDVIFTSLPYTDQRKIRLEESILMIM